MSSRVDSANPIRRVVAKFGTSTLTLPNGRLNEPFIAEWVSELAALRKSGVEILIVSSGAIGAGMGEMGLDRRPESLPEKQAIAAIGQNLLMDVWGGAFRTHGLHVAQILLTRSDMDDRRRNINVRNCLLQLLAMGVVPIINENDTVAVDELTFGDNDTLSAIIAPKIDADLLVILTNVEGVYEKDPALDPSARVVPLVRAGTREVERMAAHTTSALGTGGMRSKVAAARGALRAGIPVVIACGGRPDTLRRLLAGESLGTRFEPAAGARLSSRERWIALGARTAGRRLIVDHGAQHALAVQKKSLLPAGIEEVEGQFEKGDVVEICDEQRRCFAKGLTNYSSRDCAKIRGCKSSEIESRLGAKPYDDVVHRDNLVVLDV